MTRCLFGDRACHFLISSWSLGSEEAADDEDGDPAEVEFIAIDGWDKVEKAKPGAVADIAEASGSDHEGEPNADNTEEYDE
ncbi:hypothetical protein N9940_01975 [bacterium]|nr:hypothetical protein [bacterium]MDA7649176.1 hypothetical protein [Akkermansiaceae bacterium]MDA7933249.1 hypothetical protein [bacterium]MDB4296334.1 hypothetical protein [bacterium]MDB4300049.1 hypothetical protein [bacterium]